MSQQINLFQPMFRRQRVLLSAAALAQCVGVAFVGLMLLYGYAAWNVAALDREVAALDAQRDAARERLVAAEQRVPERSPSPILAAALAGAQLERDRHRALDAALAARASGRREGFSAYFAGLARRRVDGLWLTDVEIAAGGEIVAIGGSARDPALVPKLVQRLAEEPAYAGVAFATLVIGRPEEARGRVDFELRTEPGAPPGDGR